MDFCVSAPGKVILFGEHAVVYNQPAIAASVSLRTHVHVTNSPEPGTIRLVFGESRVTHDWKIEDLPESARTPDVSINEPLVQHVAQCIPKHLQGFHRSSCLMFLYLYVSIIPAALRKPLTFTVTSELPMGAGLGSSAAYSAALSAALLYLAGSIDMEARDQLSLINSWAFVGEQTILKSPSGIDNLVAVYGGAVYYRKPDTIVRMAHVPELSLLLTDTRQSRQTATLVGKVADLKTKESGIVASVLTAMGTVADAARGILSHKNTQSTADLLPLVQISHGLLVALGVSHPKLELVKAVSDELHLGQTKLTGAGGGGCALTLLDDTLTSDELRLKVLEFETRVLSHGFQIFQASLGGKGVAIQQAGREWRHFN